jgi:hypothetical protein
MYYAEAAHFLLGYLVGCPVTNYSIELGRERTEFVESRLQKRLIEEVSYQILLDCFVSCGRTWGILLDCLCGVAGLGEETKNVRCATLNAGLLCAVWQSFGVMLKTPA